MAVCELVRARRLITMDEEKLIESVRGFPWQVSAKSYKDIKAKENAWKVICSEVRRLCTYSMRQKKVTIPLKLITV